jgi:hypothetical protein
MRTGWIRSCTRTIVPVFARVLRAPDHGGNQSDTRVTAVSLTSKPPTRWICFESHGERKLNIAQRAAAALALVQLGLENRGY